ncbi:hypothetical protein KC851_01475 [Candidatus Kaiserbacteria bacterium]|nr:hypothetical protein [Candidatus Kaiserbacteria bacterium]
MKIVTVNDNGQKNYVYELSEPIGKNFDSEFKPHLTPKEMLELGVFGGNYFFEMPAEFPQSWFKKAKISKTGKAEKDLNYFGVNASQPLEVWQQKGWINKDDPLGWFQWYCRYYLGRRHEDDERQIKRWKAINRHIAQVVHNCRPGDFSCRPRQKQAILHWAYDSRKL